MAVLFEIFLSPWFRLAFSIAVANVPTSSCDQISFGNSKNLIKRSQVAIDTFAAQKISADAGNLDKFSNLTNIQHPGCSIDRNEYPNISDLAECRNSTLFTIWRPKARVIGSRGWLNDPMGIYQTKNGTWHIGYQCQPNNILWANMSMCALSTTDFTYFNDYRGWENPITISPTQLYDIRGVFDGPIIKDGWNGFPTIFYTSVSFGPLGWHSQPPESEGVETQSLAYTEDDGETWTKLNFGGNGNPVIYYWPENNLTGFRDPFVFESDEFSAFYANKSIEHKIPNNSTTEVPKGSKFLTISGGIRADANPAEAGPRLFLYRQKEDHNVLDWTYLGSLISLPSTLEKSAWGGSTGTSFECGSMVALNEHGRQVQAINGTNPKPEEDHKLNILFAGTEGARNHTHLNYWPIWNAISYDYNHPDGNVKANIDFSGVIDWGRSYAYLPFEAADNRQIMVGWCYEDDEHNVLTYQRGYQGSFTLFRDIFVKVIRNIRPGIPELHERGPNWTIRTEKDGSTSVLTLGQKIVSETINAYKKESTISKPVSQTIDLVLSTNSTIPPTTLVGFESQPSDRFYAITAQLDFNGASQNSTHLTPIDRSGLVRGGFRVLASDHEWTDIYYDPSDETLVVSRTNSSLISAYGTSDEVGRLRLWPIQDPITNITTLESLNLTVVVDNSIVEVYANEQAVITTRVYPWLLNSTGVSYLVQAGKHWNTTSSHLYNSQESEETSTGDSNFLPHSVTFSNVELWDGLLNAWPNRPRDSSLPGTFSHNITSSIYGLWADL